MASLLSSKVVPEHALEIERRLTLHYLRSDGKESGGSIRYVDATDPELNEALGRDDGFLALVRACGSGTSVARVLANGFVGTWPDKDAPGYLRFLITCCAVVARSDANAESKDFRVNLGSAFGTGGTTFGSLNALPELWERLATWCAFKRQAGVPIREIVLPERHKWARIGKHVGLTQVITFPAWRDLQHLRSVAGHDVSLQRLADPFEAAKRLPRLIEHDRQFSDAMREAVEEYRRLYEARASMLRLHRFWKAIRGVLGERTRGVSRLKLEPRIELSFSLDMYDTTMRVRAVDCESGSLADDENAEFSDSVERALQVMPQWLRHRGFQTAAHPILRVLLEGGLPFFEEGLGIWVASHRRGLNPNQRCIVLHVNGGSGRLGRIAPASRWFGDRCAVSDVLTAGQVRAVFDELGRILQTRDLSPLRATEPKVVGGFKTGSMYLGRPGLLPRIETPGEGRLRLLVPGTDEDDVEVAPSEDGRHRLSTRHPLSGPRLLRYEERPLDGVEPLVWQKTLTFTPSAHEHERLTEADVERWVRADEYVVDEGTEIPIAFEDDAPVEASAIDDELARRFDDFLEALYASGRSGWSEPELIETMRAVLGADSPSAWDVMRALEESTWLVCRRAIAWRARRWWLQRPQLFVPNDRRHEIAILGGSAPEAIRRRFSTTATTLGGRLEERRGVGPCSPRLCVARGIEPRRLAEELGWPLRAMPQWPVSAAPAGWPSETSDPGSHEMAGSWNWRRGHFVPGAGAISDLVQLERFARARRDRPDLFLVTGGKAREPWVSASRVIAVTEAHRRAGVPMFSLEGRLVVRLPTDGHLPFPLALGANLRRGRTSGPARMRDGWRYAYPADDWIVDALRRVLGPTIVAGGRAPAVVGLSPAELVGRRRHRG